MQVQLLPVQRISINTSLANQMGSRKREEIGNSSRTPEDLTILISSLAASQNFTLSIALEKGIIVKHQYYVGILNVRKRKQKCEEGEGGVVLSQVS